MSDSGTDQRTAGKEPNPGDPPPPAELALQVAKLAGDDSPFRNDELPLWSRLGKDPKRLAGLSRLVIGLAWCTTIGLLVVAALRMLWHDAAAPLAWLNAFTLYLYLPAYLTLAFAAWARRFWLAVASALVIACHLTWVMPDCLPARPYSPPNGAPSVASPTVRIFYANVHSRSNRDVEGVLAEAMHSDTDVIILAELDPTWIRQLLPTQSSLKAYPYGTDMQHRNSGDMCIFSRLPTRRMAQFNYQWRTSLAVDVKAGNDWLRIFAVHSPRPTLRVEDNYYEFWDQVDSVIRTFKGPLVVIGDCNATQHSLVYEQLEDEGLRSAHEDRGRGYATTWPNGYHWIPPIRIDQAFLSPEVECTSIVEGDWTLSDHKPLILDIRVHAVRPTDPHN